MPINVFYLFFFLGLLVLFPFIWKEFPKYELFVLYRTVCFNIISQFVAFLFTILW